MLKLSFLQFYCGDKNTQLNRTTRGALVGGDAYYLQILSRTRMESKVKADCMNGAMV